MYPRHHMSRNLATWSLLLMLIWAVTWAPAKAQRDPIHLPTDTETDQLPCMALNKVHLNQSDTTIYNFCIHILEFMTVVPDLTGFTTDFWINLDTIANNATVFTYVSDKCFDHLPGVCLDYECDKPDNTSSQWRSCNCPEACNGKKCKLCDLAFYGRSTLITFKFVPPHSWELTIMGMQILMAVGPSVAAGTWHHILLSWHREAPATVWMDAKLIYQQQKQQQMISLVIPGGGIVKVGQSESALGGPPPDWKIPPPPRAWRCVDQGEGLRGWITLFNLDSRAIRTPDDTSSKEKIKRLYSQCGAIPKGHNIVEWVQTLRKGRGGIATHLAQEQCHHF